MIHAPDDFYQVLSIFGLCFNQDRSFQAFLQIALGWTLCRGRAMITNFRRLSGAPGHWNRSYHLLGKTRWECSEASRELIRLILRSFPQCWWAVAIDDTMTERPGPNVFGRQVQFLHTKKRFGTGHCWVTLSLLLWFPIMGWVSFPLAAKLYLRKKNLPAGRIFKTKLVLAKELLTEVASAFPFPGIAVVDGGYAKKEFLQGLPKGWFFLARLRADAALFDPAPTAEHPRRGRPRQYGRRVFLAQKVKELSGPGERISLYGQTVNLRLAQLIGLWKPGGGLVSVTISQDAAQRRKPSFFVSNNAQLSAQAVVWLYTGRWKIEQDFCEAKMEMRIEDAQVCRGESVEHHWQLGLWLMAAIKIWYLRRFPHADCFERGPWYNLKELASFADMRKALRREILSGNFGLVWDLAETCLKKQQVSQLKELMAA